VRERDDAIRGPVEPRRAHPPTVTLAPPMRRGA
jgi:hypothetical protein